ncbi:MAG TPA: DUF1028 domain-containing protein, partial [Longimicrobium sp.]
MNRSRSILFLALASTAIAAPAPVGAQAAPPLSTFSIVACDPAGGFWGVAVQSRVVGAGSIVPAAEADAGAIATQAAANVSFKRRGLELLRAGRTADEVRAAFVAGDSGIAYRQFAVADRECRVAAFTGDSTSGWAGHRTGPHFSVQGNILTGPEVVDAMGRAYQQADSAGRPFGERLLAALKAGQEEPAGDQRQGRSGDAHRSIGVRRGNGRGVRGNLRPPLPLATAFARCSEPREAGRAPAGVPCLPSVMPASVDQPPPLRAAGAARSAV